MSFSRGNAPLRNEASVNLNYQMITAKGDMPVPPPPYELLGIISNSEWDERLHLILTHLSRTTWSLWLRIYVLVGVIVSSIGPWPIIMAVQRAIVGDRGGNNGLAAPFIPDDEGFVLDEAFAERVRNARMASGGILLAIWLIVWAPLLIYLAFQSHRLSNLLASFTSSDALKGSHQSLRWSINRRRFLTRSCVLVIGLPSKLVLASAGVGSNFHPNAYAHLPPYVQRASYDRPPSEKGHVRRRSGSIGSVGSAGSSGSWGRNRPEQRMRFDYNPGNMFGAPPMPGLVAGPRAMGRV